MVEELRKAERYIFLEYFIVKKVYHVEYHPGHSEGQGPGWS